MDMFRFPQSTGLASLAGLRPDQPRRLDQPSPVTPPSNPGKLANGHDSLSKLSPAEKSWVQRCYKKDAATRGIDLCEALKVPSSNGCNVASCLLSGNSGFELDEVADIFTVFAEDLQKIEPSSQAKLLGEIFFPLGPDSFQMWGNDTMPRPINSATAKVLSQLFLADKDFLSDVLRNGSENALTAVIGCINEAGHPDRMRLYAEQNFLGDLLYNGGGKGLLTAVNCISNATLELTQLFFADEDFLRNVLRNGSESALTAVIGCIAKAGSSDIARLLRDRDFLGDLRYNGGRKGLLTAIDCLPNAKRELTQLFSADENFLRDVLRNGSKDALTAVIGCIVEADPADRARILADKNFLGDLLSNGNGEGLITAIDCFSSSVRRELAQLFLANKDFLIDVLRNGPEKALTAVVGCIFKTEGENVE